MKLKYVTLTGADDQTSMVDLISLSTEFPFVEWAMLHSNTRMGSVRYPQFETTVLRLESLPSDVKVAVHLCGASAFEAIQGGPVANTLIRMVTARNGRIQLNISGAAYDTMGDSTEVEFRKLHERWPETKFILQHSARTAKLIPALEDIDNITFLHDWSGGRGLRVCSWGPPPTRKPYGYAGGIGPDTIKEDLASISTVTDREDLWVDMETKLRTDTPESAFDMLKCRRVLRAASPWVESSSVTEE